MAELSIELPVDRDYTGVVKLVSDTGVIIAGPFRVCGRATDTAARAHGNPRRDPLLPYGDTPLGDYRLRSVIETGELSEYDPDKYGPNGLVVLDAVGGDAALAEAAGRFHVFIQGGKLGRRRRLAATNGCLRLSNADMAELVDAIRRYNPQSCRCVEASVTKDSVPVAVDVAYDEGDPPPLHASGTARSAASPARRDFMLRLGFSAAAFAFAGPVFVAGSWTEPAYAGAYNFTVKQGVDLSDELKPDVKSISDEYKAKTGQGIVVTDADRAADDQASALFNKLQKGEDLNKLYANKPALKEIVDAYKEGKADGESAAEIKSEMAGVIQDQVDSGVYISKHLKDDAFDVRSRGMTAQQIADFKKSAEDNGYKVIKEGDHLHVQKK